MNGKTESLKQKKEILKQKNTMVKIKNSLGGFNSTMEMREEKFSEPEDQLIEIIRSEKQKEKNIGEKN